MNKKLLTVAIAGAMAVPMSAQAVKYKLSGQVNRAIVFQDDGAVSDVRHVDNIASGTRVRLQGSEDLGNGMQVGFYWELQTSSNPSNAGFPDQNNDGNQNTNDIRHANVWFSGNWGKLTIGQHDAAANGAVEVDLSGTQNAGPLSFRGSLMNGMRWRTANGGFLANGGAFGAQTGAGGALTHGNTFSSFDGFSRYDGVRYDTPALGPVVLSASVGNDAQWEVAAWLDTALGGGKLAGAVFYGEKSGGVGNGVGNAGNTDSRWGGSLSYLFAQGTSISGFYAENETEFGQDAETWGAQIGHKWGNNAVAISYGESDGVSQSAAGDFENAGWTVAFNHNIPKAKTNLYAAYVHAELDTPAGVASVEDMNMFLVGARVRFD